MTATEWAVGIAAGFALWCAISFAAGMWLAGAALKPRKRHRPY